MDQITQAQEVSDALHKKSKSTTLDELRRRGRQHVKVIRAQDIAGMINETVCRVVREADRGFTQEQVDALVEQSTSEFKVALAERQRELDESRQMRERLEALTQEHERVLVEQQEQADVARQAKCELDSLREEHQQVLGQRQQQLDEARQVRDRLEVLTREHQQLLDAQQGEDRQAEQARQQVAALDAEYQRVCRELEAAVARIEVLTQEVKTAQQVQQALAAARAPAPQPESHTTELMLRMMAEMAEVKASMAHARAATPSAAPDGQSGNVSAALDKIASSLEQRLETFGKKIGISAAVDSKQVDFGALFKQEQDVKLESNMGDVQVKQKKGGGIGDTLEKLKKLKGGG
ncbi:MAG: hypothetical protein H6836_05040 [Planctomycetes bacterium]|nr:hypothetical protein [Planctomycetota bacterium]MCB9888921.1 hypothetical protein [Planctomycetota bacterium]